MALTKSIHSFNCDSDITAQEPGALGRLLTYRKKNRQAFLEAGGVCSDFYKIGEQISQEGVKSGKVGPGSRW